MGAYDYAVVIIYLGFLLAIGLVFRKFNEDSSEYFRCGGHVVWWMVGATAFMTQFSAWTFTGAAGKAYTDGSGVLVIYLGNALGYFIAFLWSAARFRQMRVITPMEAVRDRFGPGNQQFFTWMWIPLGICYAAIWLSAMSTFVSAVFDIDPTVTIVVAGLVVLLTAAIGGGGAVVASDFIQLVLLVPVSLIVAFLAIQAVGGGHVVDGLSRFLERLPESHGSWLTRVHPQIVVFWIAATLLKQCCTTNNMNDSNRFLVAIDSRAARRAALMASVLFIVGPIIWFVPPMAAAMLYPDLGVIAQLSRLGDRLADGAYVAMGLTTLPAGMVGLMVAAVFGVTMSSMDSGLNKNAGIFIRNFYKPILRPHAGEREYVRAGEVTSAVFGVLVIATALGIQRVEHVRLFDVMMLFSSMAVVPFVLPLIWGVIIERTPAWSGWSTVCVALVTSMLSPSLLETSFARGLLGLDAVIAPREAVDVLFAGSVFLNVAVGSLWFVGSALSLRFGWARPSAHEADREAFFERMRTPVTHGTDDEDARSLALVRSLSMLSVPYGGLVLLFAAIPNSMAGRLSFLFAGGFVIAVGLVLRRSAQVRHVPPEVLACEQTTS